MFALFKRLFFKEIEYRAQVNKVKEEHEQRLQNIKREFKDDRKKLDQLESRLKEVSKELVELRQSEREAKTEVINLKKTNFNHLSEIENLSSKVKSLENRDENVGVHKIAIAGETPNRKYEALQNNHNKLFEKYKFLLSERDKLQQKVIKLKNEMKTYESLNSSEDNSNELSRSLMGVKKELSFYKGRVEELESIKFSIDDALSLLKSHLTIENAKQYSNDVQDIVSRVRHLRRLKEEKTIEEERTFEFALENAEIGCIVQINDKWFFKNFNEDLYPILEFEDEFEDGSPAKVAITDSIATVLETYDVKNVGTVRTSKKKKKKTAEKTARSYMQFGSYEVLVVGSINKLHYINRLESHGLEAVWHDPFEESDERLKSKARRADVVVICTSHIPHNVTNCLDVSEPNIYMIEKDNKDSIAALVYNAINQLKQLEVVNENM